MLSLLFFTLNVNGDAPYEFSPLFLCSFFLAFEISELCLETGGLFKHLCDVLAVESFPFQPQSAHKL